MDAVIVLTFYEKNKNVVSRTLTGSGLVKEKKKKEIELTILITASLCVMFVVAFLGIVIQMKSLLDV